MVLVFVQRQPWKKQTSDEALMDVWETRYDVLSMRLQTDPAVMSVEHLLLGWNTVCLFPVLFLWHVSHWKEKSKYKVCTRTWLWGCNYSPLVQYSNSGSGAFFLLLLQTNKSECPPQLFSSAQNSAKENDLWVRNTLRLLAFYPRNWTNLSTV